MVFIWMEDLPLSILMEVLVVRSSNEQSGSSPRKNYCGGLHPSAMKIKANWLHMVFSLVIYKCFCLSEGQQTVKSESRKHSTFDKVLIGNTDKKYNIATNLMYTLHSLTDCCNRWQRNGAGKDHLKAGEE